MNTCVELKQLVDDSNFIECMNKAFSDLRADYDLTMDITQSKIKELTELHVDIKNHLSDLTAWSKKSSGTICGLRGTGKTHLMLLARHNLNSKLWMNDDGGNLCIYLNMKRLTLPEEFTKDTFNRIFSIYIYEEMARQLRVLLDCLKTDSLLQRVISFFDKNRMNVKSQIKEVIECLYTMKAIAAEGNVQIGNIGDGLMEKEEVELDRLIDDINASLNVTGSNAKIELKKEIFKEIKSKIKKDSKYIQYLNIKSVHNHLLKIISLLGIDSITFYVDEWEKISSINNCQEYAAAYINQMIDDPIYFWIGIVPYRGGLYQLSNGSDLQHQIDLNESLIFEASDKDRTLCINYFKEIVNKRLEYYFPDKGYTYKMMFNRDDNFSMLVMASMGNTRDFGTMFLKCWSEYQSYRRSRLTPGRPFKFISKSMIINAIKDNGDKKYSNIDSDTDVVKVWNNIKSYCVGRKSSHFAMEENPEVAECLARHEYSELIYHRLLHLRKTHVPAKETDIEHKLSIYAINYAAAYPLHAQDKKILFVTDYKTIHDRARRYIYNPKSILDDIQIEKGVMFPCISCKRQINPSVMVAAWEKNSCPFCGGAIYTPNNIKSSEN